MTIIGNKVPFRYFLTKGKGESNYGGKGDPYEAGSYDGALNDAGIQNANIVKYTSVIPRECVEITKAEGKKSLHWGQVMDTIMAQMNGNKGDQITAALLITHVYKGTKYLGGFACEYAGPGSKAKAKDVLLHDVQEMIERRGYGKTKSKLVAGKKLSTSKGYHYVPYRLVSETLKVKKNHGTVLAAACFTKYFYPEVSVTPVRKSKK